MIFENRKKSVAKFTKKTKKNVNSRKNGYPNSSAPAISRRAGTRIGDAGSAPSLVRLHVVALLDLSARHDDFHFVACRELLGVESGHLLEELLADGDRVDRRIRAEKTRQSKIKK